MVKKRVDVELPLEALAWYSYQATKANMSRRQYMTNVLYNIWNTVQQSPNMPVKSAIEFNLLERVEDGGSH